MKRSPVAGRRCPDSLICACGLIGRTILEEESDGTRSRSARRSAREQSPFVPPVVASVAGTVISIDHQGRKVSQGGGPELFTALSPGSVCPRSSPVARYKPACFRSWSSSAVHRSGMRTGFLAESATRSNRVMIQEPFNGGIFPDRTTVSGVLQPGAEPLAKGADKTLWSVFTGRDDRFLLCMTRFTRRDMVALLMKYCPMAFSGPSR